MMALAPVHRLDKDSVSAMIRVSRSGVTKLRWHFFHASATDRDKQEQLWQGAIGSAQSIPRRPQRDIAI